jgi:hypothetical protein
MFVENKRDRTVCFSILFSLCLSTIMISSKQTYDIRLYRSCWNVSTSCIINFEKYIYWFAVAIKNCLRTQDITFRRANRKYRRCFFIIAKFICDYEERIIITNIKSDQHSTICQISLDQRENLKRKWSIRIYDSTQQQIRRQRQNRIIKTDEQWVHEMMNFAWEHSLVNIHETMMIDVFHQLFKEMIMHLLIWIRLLLKKEMSTARKWKDEALTSSDLFDLDCLDARFRKISKFTNLKRFSNFSNVKQWTSNEQKTIVRQIISMITSLLIKKWSNVLKFFRVLFDFILMTQYRFHDDNILFYLDHALYRINAFKHEFRDLRSQNKNIEEDHFNFLKFHVMSHYSEFIRKYETIDEYDTFHDEIKHKYMLKKYYEKINKRDTFQEQLFWHNKRRVNVLTLKNIFLYNAFIWEREHISLQNIIKIKITRSFRDYLDLIELDVYDNIQKTNEIWNSIKSSRQWCLISDLTKWMSMSNIIFALTIFIRKQHRATNNVQEMSVNDKYRCESNSSWMKNLYVSIHDFLTCW